MAEGASDGRRVHTSPAGRVGGHITHTGAPSSLSRQRIRAVHVSWVSEGRVSARFTCAHTSAGGSCLSSAMDPQLTCAYACVDSPPPTLVHLTRSKGHLRQHTLSCVRTHAPTRRLAPRRPAPFAPPLHTQPHQGSGPRRCAAGACRPRRRTPRQRSSSRRFSRLDSVTPARPSTLSSAPSLASLLT